MTLLRYCSEVSEIKINIFSIFFFIKTTYTRIYNNVINTKKLTVKIIFKILEIKKLKSRYVGIWKCSTEICTVQFTDSEELC